LSLNYKAYASPQYHQAFNDITTGDSNCKTGWDICAGVGSAHTYRGK